VLGGTTGKVKDLRGLAVRGDEVYLLAESGMTVQLRSKGGLQRQTSVVQGRSLFLDADGVMVVVGRNGLQREGGRFTPVAVPKPDKTMKPLESITAGAMLSTGETLIADEDGRLVYLFNRELKLLKNFATGRADRMVVGSTDQVAMLDGGEKSVTIYSRDGRVVTRVATRGSGWSLDEPVDLAFDPFDHLYVLDRGLKSVLVFALGQTPRLLKTFTLADEAPGAFRRATTLAVDHAGRLYIHDNRAERVQVYQ
jgi:hypothetical protein